MIFWQTARTAKNARPGQRVPTRRASELDQITIAVDTRERYPYKFANRPVESARTALPAGDYAIRDQDRIIAVVERKTAEDFNKSLIDGSLNYRLAELAAFPAAAVVVEQRYGALLNDRYSQPGWLAARARGSPPGPLSRDPDRVRRFAQARRGIHLPLPRRRARPPHRRPGHLT